MCSPVGLHCELESKRFVRRQPHVADRRSILAKITARGRNAARQASDALVEVKFGIVDMTDQEAQTIATSIRQFRGRISDFV